MHKKYRQGKFNPFHPEKYKGELPIYYRSGLELDYFKFCDDNSNVLEWTSESLAIPYKNPLKMDKNRNLKVSRYFPDLTIILKLNNNTQKKYLVEIKPSSQCRPPVNSGKRSKAKLFTEQLRFAQNMAKWDAAKQWCEKNDYNFIILTEKDRPNRL